MYAFILHHLYVLEGVCRLFLREGFWGTEPHRTTTGMGRRTLKVSYVIKISVNSETFGDFDQCTMHFLQFIKTKYLKYNF